MNKTGKDFSQIALLSGLDSHWGGNEPVAQNAG